MARTTCAACHREIDATARLCAYCGADPLSGVKTDLIGLGVDAGTPIAARASRRAGRFARRRQGLLIATAIAGALIALLGLYEILRYRNKAVTGATAATLTEIVDVKTPPSDTKSLPLRPMAFQFQGKPEAMRTLILEPGAVKPPEVLAAEREAQVKKPPRGPRLAPQTAVPTP